jgi:hypothetical protein
MKKEIFVFNDSMFIGEQYQRVTNHKKILEIIYKRKDAPFEIPKVGDVIMISAHNILSKHLTFEYVFTIMKVHG